MKLVKIVYMSTAALLTNPVDVGARKPIPSPLKASFNPM